MAIATLALVYRNPAVFERNIKIRRGESCKVSTLSPNTLTISDILGIWGSILTEVVINGKHKYVRRLQNIPSIYPRNPP